MNQTRQFYDKVWAYKVNFPDTPIHNQFTPFLDTSDWEILMFETYKQLCERRGLDPLQDHPVINMQMNDMDWIEHAKDLGILTKRTRKEAIKCNELLSEDFQRSIEEEDHDYRDVDTIYNNGDGTQTRITYDEILGRDIEIKEPLENTT